MWRFALICVGLIGCGSSISADEAASACVIFGSCMGDGINDCYTDAMPYWTTAEARCVLAAAPDCTAVRACFGMTLVADPSCTARTITCEGNNMVTCSDGVRSTISCPDASLTLRVGTGATCVMTSTGALCGDASCSAATATCDGSVAKVCNTDKGVLLSVDCASYGQTCTSGACTSAGGGGTCATSTPASCDGASIVRCSGGVELRTDCSALVTGASCFPGSATNPEVYCGLGNACYPEKGAETCSGNAVGFCAGGTSSTVDCTALGFTRCISGRCSAI